MRAIAGPRPSQPARLVIATFAFACAWLITAALDAMRAPDWTMFMGGAVIGRGGPRRHWPHAPRPGGGGSDPSRWPEFERRLASYVAERERENRPRVAPSG